MNKRQSKKRYKKALELMKAGRKAGVGVSIINQIYVDGNGKKCDSPQKDGYLIMLKRPQIRYFKQTN